MAVITWDSFASPPTTEVVEEGVRVVTLDLSQFANRLPPPAPARPKSVVDALVSASAGFKLSR